MSTKFMKLGFKPIRNEEIKNIIENNVKIGYTFDYYLNFYRGLHLSNIEKLEVTVDKKLEEEVYLLINGKRFSTEQLTDLVTEFWPIKKPIKIVVINHKGLNDGVHHVEVTLNCRCPYMKFAPRTYAMIDSSDTAKMKVMEVM